MRKRKNWHIEALRSCAITGRTRQLLFRLKSWAMLLGDMMRTHKQDNLPCKASTFTAITMINMGWRNV
jgi:hypothetical protein